MIMDDLRQKKYGGRKFHLDALFWANENTWSGNFPSISDIL